MPSRKKIEEVLKQIPDPEIGVSLWDLGLIYDIAIDKKSAIIKITMTLTTVGCPLFDLIANPIKEGVGKLRGVKQVDIELTFDPPWSTDRLTKKAKEQLGIF